MSVHKFGLIFRLGLLLALALSACQRAPGPAPLPSSTASAAPTHLPPTQTPTPATTDTPAPQARAGQTHADSYNPRISADGRFIAFDSPGNDLLKWKLPECPDRSWRTPAGQPCWQVYLYDQQAGTTELVSMNSSGEPGNSLSSSAALSTDGRYVAFVSYATNLAGDSAAAGSETAATPPASASATGGIYLRDRQANSIVRVSSSGAHPAISADGNWIVYEDSLNGIGVIRLYDRQSGKITLVSRPDSSLTATLTPTSPPASSGATTPAPTASKTGSPTASGTPTDQPTATPSPTPRPAPPTAKPKATATASGSPVAKGSPTTPGSPIPSGGTAATVTGTPTPTATSTPTGGALGPVWHSVMPSISADGNWIAFWSWDGHLVPGDTVLCNDGQVNCGDLFLYDRAKQKMTRVAMDESYGEGMVFYPTSLSADGRWLASRDVVYDRLTRRIIKTKTNAEGIKLSADGRWLTYQVGPRIFVQPAGGGKAEQVTVSSEGAPGTGVLVASTMCTGAPQCQRDPSFSLSADGRYAAFDSTAADLDGNDPWLCAGSGVIPHNCADIFVRDRQTGQTRWITRPALPGPISGVAPPNAPALPLRRLSLGETSLSPLEGGNYRQTDRQVWFLSPESWRFDATITLPAQSSGAQGGGAQRGGAQRGGAPSRGVTLQRASTAETEGKTRVYDAQSNTLAIRGGSLDHSLPGGPPLYGTADGLRGLPDLLARLAPCYPQATFLGEGEEIAGQRTYVIYLGISQCKQAAGVSPTPGTATPTTNAKSAEANAGNAVQDAVTDSAAQADGPETIWVEQRSLVVLRWVIQNPNGETSLYQMEVSQIDHNTEIPTAWFTDIAPQGAKIDDQTK